ncbi:hypothetical protein [Gemmiger sp.]
MNNFKKFAAVLLGVVMACVFATSAFADSASDKAKIIAKMNEAGLTGYESIIDKLDDNGVAVLMQNKDTLIGQANQVKACLNDNHPAEQQAEAVKKALDNVKGILSAAGISASVDVKVEGNTVVATATASTAGAPAVSKVITETVDPSKETNADNSSKATTSTSTAVNNAVKSTATASVGAANPVVASSNAVIKATGDNSAVVFVAAALAVAGVLGMAVRKERAL